MALASGMHGHGEFTYSWLRKRSEISLARVGGDGGRRGASRGPKKRPEFRARALRDTRRGRWPAHANFSSPFQWVIQEMFLFAGKIPVLPQIGPLGVSSAAKGLQAPVLPHFGFVFPDLPHFRPPPAGRVQFFQFCRIWGVGVQFHTRVDGRTRVDPGALIPRPWCEKLKPSTP